VSLAMAELTKIFVVRMDKLIAATIKNISIFLYVLFLTVSIILVDLGTGLIIIFILIIDITCIHVNWRISRSFIRIAKTNGGRNDNW